MFTGQTPCSEANKIFIGFAHAQISLQWCFIEQYRFAVIEQGEHYKCASIVKQQYVGVSETSNCYRVLSMKSPHDILLSGGNSFIISAPVSYTHLDVYKRQLLYSINQRFRRTKFFLFKKNKTLPVEYSDRGQTYKLIKHFYRKGTIK